MQRKENEDDPEFDGGEATKNSWHGGLSGFPGSRQTRHCVHSERNRSLTGKSKEILLDRSETSGKILGWKTWTDDGGQV